MADLVITGCGAEQMETWSAKVTAGINTKEDQDYIIRLKEYLDQYAAKEGLTVSGLLRIIASGEYDLVVYLDTIDALAKVKVTWGFEKSLGSKQFHINLHSAYSPFISDIMTFFKIVPKSVMAEEPLGQIDMLGEVDAQS